MTTLALISATWRDRAKRHAYLIVAVCYTAMIAVFFVFNQPVNKAVDGWTPATLPPDWSDYRLRWETGHALAALLSVLAFVTLLRQYIRNTTR
jgi:uncharacterized membrane protein YhaH (DUF805 family)